MSDEIDRALRGLQTAQAEGVHLLIENIRRRALYPNLAAMEKQTHTIRLKQANIPLMKANADVEHLLHHIDMLQKELRK